MPAPPFACRTDAPPVAGQPLPSAGCCGGPKLAFPSASHSRGAQAEPEAGPSPTQGSHPGLRTDPCRPAGARLRVPHTSDRPQGHLGHPSSKAGEVPRLWSASPSKSAAVTPSLTSPLPRGSPTSRAPRSAQQQFGAVRASPGGFKPRRPLLRSSPRSRQPYFQHPTLPSSPLVVAPPPESPAPLRASRRKPAPPPVPVQPRHRPAPSPLPAWGPPGSRTLTPSRCRCPPPASPAPPAPPAPPRTVRLRPGLGKGRPARASLRAPPAQAGAGSRAPPRRGVFLGVVPEQNPVRAMAEQPPSQPRRAQRTPLLEAGGRDRTLPPRAARSRVQRAGPRGAPRPSARPSSRLLFSFAAPPLSQPPQPTPVASSPSACHATPSSSPAAILTPEWPEAPLSNTQTHPGGRSWVEPDAKP